MYSFPLISIKPNAHSPTPALIGVPIHSFIDRFIRLPSIHRPNYPQLMTHKQCFTHSVYCRHVHDLLCTVCQVANSSASLTPTIRRATNIFRAVGYISHKLPHLKLHLFRLRYYHKTFWTLFLFICFLFVCVCVCVCVCVWRARLANDVSTSQIWASAMFLLMTVENSIIRILGAVEQHSVRPKFG